METMVAQVTVGFASPSTAGQTTHRQLHLSSGERMHRFSGEMPVLYVPHV